MSLVAEKFIYAVFVLSVALVLVSGWGFGETWVWLAMVVYLAALGLSHSVTLPSAKKLNTLLRELGDDPSQGPKIRPQLDALGKKLGGSSMFLHVALVVVIVLMIWKPGA